MSLEVLDIWNENASAIVAHEIESIHENRFTFAKGRSCIVSNDFQKVEGIGGEMLSYLFIS